MLKIYESTNQGLAERTMLGIKGSWIHLENPSREEREQVSIAVGLPLDFLEYPLDEEETSRMEFEEKGVLVIIKVPLLRGSLYDTIPLGVIITEDVVVTVCLEGNDVTNELRSGKQRGFFTYKRTRFLLHILYTASILYLRYLRQIDKKSETIRNKLQHSTRNKELIDLLDLGKSLVYFTTSLRSNEIVMEKILKSYLTQESRPEHAMFLKMYHEDKELLDDVMIENKQAIEMGDIYTSILNSTMDAFASIISNNLNIVLKFLTVVTIILMIPTVVFSFFGMNVPLPGENSSFAFAGIVLSTVLISLIAVLALRWRRMF